MRKTINEISQWIIAFSLLFIMLLAVTFTIYMAFAVFGIIIPAWTAITGAGVVIVTAITTYKSKTTKDAEVTS